MERKVYFYSPDGIRLCGILTTPSAKTDRCVILCHGISMNKNEWYGLHKWQSKRLVDAGFTTFRFDFRGHGESAGRSIDLTVTGEARDLEAAIKLMRKLGYRKMGIIGASFSGGAVLLTVPKHQDIIRAIVFEWALVDYVSLLKPKLPWPKEFFGKKAMRALKEKGCFKLWGYHGAYILGQKVMDDMKKLKPWKSLRTLKMPILFVHGDKDTYIPYTDSIKYARMGRNSKAVIIKGGGHGFTGRDSVRVQKMVVRFFDQNV